MLSCHVHPRSIARSAEFCTSNSQIVDCLVVNHSTIRDMHVKFKTTNSLRDRIQLSNGLLDDKPSNIKRRWDQNSLSNRERGKEDGNGNGNEFI